MAEPQPRPKPQRKRRWLRRLLGVLATPIVLVAVLVGLLHTGPGQRLVRDRVVKRASERIDGTLAIGALEFALFGEIAVRDVVVKDAAGAEVLALRSLTVRPAWWDLLAGQIAFASVVLDGVTVSLVKHADGTTNLKRLLKPQPPEPPGPPPVAKERRIRVDALSVSDVDVTITQPDGSTVAVSDLGLEAAIDAVPMRRDVKVTMPRLGADVVVQKPGLRLGLAGLRTGLEVDLRGGTGSVTLLETTGKAQIQDGLRDRETELRLDGVRIGIEPGDVAATLAGLGTGALLLDAIEIHGRTGDDGLEGEQKAHVVGLKLDAARLNELLGRDLLAGDVKLETRIDGPPEKLMLGTTVDAAGGRVKIDGAVDASTLASPGYDMSVTVTGVDTEKLLRASTLPPVTVERLRLGLHGAGASAEEAEADVGLHVTNITVGKYVVDDVELAARLDGGRIRVDPLAVDAYGQRLTVRGVIDLLRRRVDVRVAVAGDAGEAIAQLREAGLEVKLQLPRGAVKLPDDALEVHVEGSLDGLLHASVALDRLVVAGGAVMAAIEADLRRNPAPGPGEKKVELVGLEGDIELEGIDLGRVLALRGKKLPGLSGTVSGRIRVEGAPAEPMVEYRIDARVKPEGGQTAFVTARGRASKSKLGVIVDVAGKDDPIAHIEATAPLLVTDTHKGLAPGRPIRAVVDVPERRLADLLPYLPPPVRARLAKVPDGSVRAHVEVEGTPAQAKGTVELDVGVAALGGKVQRVAVHGTLDGATVQAGLEGWLDARGARALDGTVSASFTKSPLARGTLSGWTVDLAIAPQELASLPLSIADRLRGQARAVIHAEGKGDDLGVNVQATVDDAGLDGKGPADARVSLVVSREDTQLDVAVDLADTPVLAVHGLVERPGRGLLGLLRDREKSVLQKIGRPRVDLRIEVPEHRVATWGAVAPALGALPGDLGGAIRLEGDPPLVGGGGEIAWTGFETWSGKDGRAALELAVSPLELSARLALGPPAEQGVGIDVSVPVLRLPGYLSARRCHAAGGDDCGDAQLPIDAHAAASAVSLRDLVPAFAVKGKPFEVDGTLDWMLEGRVLLDAKPRYAEVDGATVKLPALSPESEIEGKLALTRGLATIPGTDRQWRDIEVQLEHDLSVVEVKKVFARESDRDEPSRTLALDARVALRELRPTTLQARLRTQDWLLFGHEKVGPADAPRGSLTSDIAVRGDLSRPVKKIDVEVGSLELLIPDRFPRAHQPEEVSLGDVYYVEGEVKAGVLPVAKKAPEPPATPEGASQGGLDLVVRIPRKVHILQDPMDLWPVGEIRVERRGEKRHIDGLLTMQDGWLSLGGRKHPLERGTIRFDDEHPGGVMDLWFARTEHETTLREVSRASAGEDVTIHLEGPLDARRTTLGGAGSPGTLFDLLSVHNAGRTRYHSQPDLPSGAVVEYPQHDNLLLLSYLAVNVPHLLFLDKVSAWSDVYDGRSNQAYGRIEHFEAEGYAADGKVRVRAAQEPPAAGASGAHLDVDWLWVNDAGTAVGIGVSAGDRLGGGPGFFVEWSSED
jgi:hypothetical protein